MPVAIAGFAARSKRSSPVAVTAYCREFVHKLHLERAFGASRVKARKLLAKYDSGTPLPLDPPRRDSAADVAVAAAPEVAVAVAVVDKIAGSSTSGCHLELADSQLCVAHYSSWPAA